MRCGVLLMSLLACGAEAPESEAGLAARGAAPGYDDFVMSQLVPGFPAGGVWVGRTPGAQVAFLVSRNGVGAGPCPTQMNGTCLDLAPPVTLIGTGRVDRLGRARVAAVLPPSLPAGPYTFQAVELDPSAPATVSNTYARGLGYVACPAVYAPVCAADFDTYGNACEAEAYGWAVMLTQPCP